MADVVGIKVALPRSSRRKDQNSRTIKQKGVKFGKNSDRIWEKKKEILETEFKWIMKRGGRMEGFSRNEGVKNLLQLEWCIEASFDRWDHWETMVDMTSTKDKSYEFVRALSLESACSVDLKTWLTLLHLVVKLEAFEERLEVKEKVASLQWRFKGLKPARWIGWHHNMDI